MPAQIIDALGLDRCMFEAADPDAFQWYIKNYGPEVNLFVDHLQIVELECQRSGIWGTQSSFGRIERDRHPAASKTPESAGFKVVRLSRTMTKNAV